MRPKNPYDPDRHPDQHAAFEHGVATGFDFASDRPKAAIADGPLNPHVANAQCGRASSHDMLMVRADQLENRARALRKLAKHAIAMEGTEADEALWMIVVNQRD